MKNEILALEEQAQKLELNSRSRRQLNTRITEYAGSFLTDMPQRKAYEKQDNSAGLEDMPIRDFGKPMEEIIQAIGTMVDRPGINPASGGHLGYIPGGGIYPSALADYLVAVSNRYAGVDFANPGAVRMENLLLRWMADMIDYPQTALGNLASGGSIANLIALTTARDSKGLSCETIPNAVIYMTAQTHHCVDKAIRIAGLAEAQIRRIPMDDHFRMDAQRLDAQIVTDISAGLRPFLIVGSIGSTDTGASDPVNEIAEIAGKHNIWLHIDAAYGGFFALLPEMAELFTGVERSDSFVIDPHKGLFLPYGIGAVLVREGEALRHSHYYRANYMQDAAKAGTLISPADLSPELTKHFRGLRMWLPLQLFGLDPFRAALREKILLCKYFYQQIQGLGFEVGPLPQLTVAIYRYIPPDPQQANIFNERLIQAVQNDGRIFISSTTIDGVFWIRIAVLCFRTHLATVELLLEILEDKKRMLLATAQFRED